MNAKPGRNAPCFCGSGKKFKRCCGAERAVTTYTQNDRHSLFEKLDVFIDTEMQEEEELAFDEFWGDFVEREDELGPNMLPVAEAAETMWFAFDRLLDDDSLAADAFLEHRKDLTAGEKVFLAALRQSSVRLYEVVDAVPGVSLTLRDVMEGGQVTVNERMGSKSISRFEWVAARVVPRGPSGGPEIEQGLLHIPGMFHDAVRSRLAEMRAEFVREEPDSAISAFYKELPPFFHEVWAGSILEPAIPELHNTDGDPVVITRTSFDVVDASSLERALDSAEGLERGGSLDWRWTGTNPRGEVVSLGTLNLVGTKLVLETNSAARGTRGRELVESVAGEAVRYRITTHEDLGRLVRERMRESFAKGEDPEDAEDTSDEPSSGIPPEVQEALVLDLYAKHYRTWVDESISALDGATPRSAATDPRLGTKLVEMIHELESMYQHALKRGEPAYDPSWMWAELGLPQGADRAHPPPLAHERVAGLVRGSGELGKSVAEELRKQPGFRDASTVLTDEACRTHLGLQRFVRTLDEPANDEGATPWKGADLSSYLGLMVNFALHRSKVFWVEESLAYMLAHTDLDVRGRELRVPFPSFALAFTDRHVLSLGERALSRDRGCPLAGQILRVATVYVTEQAEGDARRLDLCFAFDALGADLPALVRHVIRLEDDGEVQACLSRASNPVVVDPPVEDRSPLRGLLQVTINAILYATSAGVEPVLRKAPAPSAERSSSHGNPRPSFSSEEVYFLPGFIEISQTRRLQELERVQEGRDLLRRFMVRGHWRRPAKNWVDRSLRWIKPYWKGPDMAAVIERTYKLRT